MPKIKSTIFSTNKSNSSLGKAVFLIVYICLFSTNFLYSANANSKDTDLNAENIIDYTPFEKPAYLTSSFAESRGTRYHAGFDFSTSNEIGWPIKAPEDGYIMRLRISPNYYGKAIYFRGNSGYIYVFAHLSGYSKEILKYIENKRAKNQLNQGSWVLSKRQQIQVKKNELIGYSGETGIGSPHLHLEIRDQSNKYVLDPKRLGINVYDTIPPRLLGVAIMRDSPWSPLVISDSSEIANNIFNNINDEKNIALALKIVDYSRFPEENPMSIKRLKVSCNLHVGGMKVASEKTLLPIYVKNYNNRKYGDMIKIRNDLLWAEEGESAGDWHYIGIGEEKDDARIVAVNIKKCLNQDHQQLAIEIEDFNNNTSQYTLKATKTNEKSNNTLTKLNNNDKMRNENNSANNTTLDKILKYHQYQDSTLFTFLSATWLNTSKCHQKDYSIKLLDKNFKTVSENICNDEKLPKIASLYQVWQNHKQAKFLEIIDASNNNLDNNSGNNPNNNSSNNSDTKSISASNATSNNILSRNTKYLSPQKQKQNQKLNQNQNYAPSIAAISENNSNQNITPNITQNTTANTIQKTKLHKRIIALYPLEKATPTSEKIADTLFLPTYNDSIKFWTRIYQPLFPTVLTVEYRINPDSSGSRIVTHPKGAHLKNDWNICVKKSQQQNPTQLVNPNFKKPNSPLLVNKYTDKLSSQSTTQLVIPNSPDNNHLFYLGETTRQWWSFSNSKDTLGWHCVEPNELRDLKLMVDTIAPELTGLEISKSKINGKDIDVFKLNIKEDLSGIVSGNDLQTWLLPQNTTSPRCIENSTLLLSQDSNSQNKTLSKNPMLNQNTKSNLNNQNITLLMQDSSSKYPTLLINGIKSKELTWIPNEFDSEEMYLMIEKRDLEIKNPTLNQNTKSNLNSQNPTLNQNTKSNLNFQTIIVLEMKDDFDNKSYYIVNLDKLTFSESKACEINH